MKLRALVCAGAVLCAPWSADAVTLDPYGFIRFDAIWDDSRLSHPQFPSWVESESPDPATAAEVGENEGEINLHARLSRVGFNVEAFELKNGKKVDGKVEIDFQNGGRESRAALRWRHAYFRLLKDDYNVLLGQTSDLIAPLYPFVNNDGAMWNAGNIGDRRPQVRITTTPAAGDGQLRLAGAVMMPGAVNSQDLDGNGVLDGAFALTPILQGLVEYSDDRVTIGGWAHFHRDRIEVDVMVDSTTTMVDERDYTGYAVGGHARLKLSDRVLIQGEGWTGQNAADIRGGIGQTVNLAADEAIASLGGWAELQLKTSDTTTLAVGATLDDPDDEHLASGGRSLNQVMFTALRVQPDPALRFAIEYLYWKTEFIDRPEGTANRINAHGTLFF